MGAPPWKLDNILKRMDYRYMYVVSIYQLFTSSFNKVPCAMSTFRIWRARYWRKHGHMGGVKSCLKMSCTLENDNFSPKGPVFWWEWTLKFKTMPQLRKLRETLLVLLMCHCLGVIGFCWWHPQYNCTSGYRIDSCSNYAGRALLSSG